MFLGASILPPAHDNLTPQASFHPPQSWLVTSFWNVLSLIFSYSCFLFIIQVSTHNSSEIPESQFHYLRTVARESTIFSKIVLQNDFWRWPCLNSLIILPTACLSLPDLSPPLWPQHSLFSKMIYWLAHFLTFPPEEKHLYLAQHSTLRT